MLRDECSRWAKSAQRPTNRRPAKKRPIDKKETRHWLDAVNTSAERIGAVPGAPRITFLVDREGDSAAMLCTLVATTHDFIVRGNCARTVRAADGRSWKVRTLMGYQKPLGSYDVELAGGPGRAARVAHVTLRAVDVLLPLKDPTTGKRREVKVSAINAREMVRCPTGEEPLDWPPRSAVPVRAQFRIRGTSSTRRVGRLHSQPGYDFLLSISSSSRSRRVQECRWVIGDGRSRPSPITQRQKS